MKRQFQPASLIVGLVSSLLIVFVLKWVGLAWTWFILCSVITNILLVYLTDQGIRTSPVVVPPKEAIVLLQDEKPVMLKGYVDGDVTADLTGAHLVQLGEEMARLHKIPAP